LPRPFTIVAVAVFSIHPTRIEDEGAIRTRALLYEAPVPVVGGRVKVREAVAMSRSRPPSERWIECEVADIVGAVIHLRRLYT
jgi:hypothetical protein